MPSTPYDVKGLLAASVQDDSPVIFLDERWLYKEVGSVPEELYAVPIGQAAVRKEGKDVTIVGTSYMAAQAVHAIPLLEQAGIDAEVIDLRTIRPIDAHIIIESVAKTGRLVVADGGWACCGVSAEVTAVVAESEVARNLKAPVKRVALPPAPAPAASTLEDVYFRHIDDIVIASSELLGYDVKSKAVH
jgi:pyruvate dehydrogenase E1 component beta subunit